MFTLMNAPRGKTMEQPIPKKTLAISTPIAPYFPIEKAKDLLNNKKCKQFLRQLKPLVNAPEAHYQKLFLGVIDKFAEFVQKLPSVRVNHFRFHGGLLELGLGRAVKSLEMYREQVPINIYTPESMPPKLSLWSYALFTASLCLGLGEIAATYWVSLCDATGNNTQRWFPQQGPMTDSGQTHYRFTIEKESWDGIAQRTTPLIAASFLPKEGLDWLATDKEVWDFWLALLQQDERGAGSFAKFVYPAQDILIQNYAEYTESLTEAMIEAARQEQNPWAERENQPQNQENNATEAVSAEQIIQLHIPNANPNTPNSILNVSGKAGTNLGTMLIAFLNGLARNGVSLEGLVVSTHNGDVILSAAFDKFVEMNPHVAKDAKSVYSDLRKMNVDTGTVQAQGARSSFASGVFGKQQLPPVSLDRTFLGPADLTVLAQEAAQYVVLPRTSAWPSLSQTPTLSLNQTNTPTPRAGG